MPGRESRHLFQRQEIICIVYVDDENRFGSHSGVGHE